MNRKSIYLLFVLALSIFFIWILSDSKNKHKDFSERVKISLRNVGHQLLLTNQDSTSLVLPVIALKNSKYQLSFQKELTIEPDSLVQIVQRSFQKSGFSQYYRIEVKQCSDLEVAYSYEMNNAIEKGIIPCRRRFLPNNCYTIEVKFTEIKPSVFSNKFILIPLIFLILFLVYMLNYKSKHVDSTGEINKEFMAIGSFQFYPNQNKLVKEALEINLSKKECELLVIFVANLNQIIKREELTKKVWEDNGVIVGRSLDTYISKLRKKLKNDPAIKLTNIHGIGYKLEIA